MAKHLKDTTPIRLFWGVLDRRALGNWRARRQPLGPSGNHGAASAALRSASNPVWLNLMAEKKAKKNAAAVALGRRGGKKRAQTLSPEQLSEQARNAVLARWTAARHKSAAAKGGE